MLLSLVLFLFRSDALRVLQKRSVTIHNIVLNVRKPTKDHRTPEAKAAPVEEDDAKTSGDVIVMGIPPDMTDDVIEMLFESERLTGGGAVQSVKLDRAKSVAVVTFEDPAGGIFDHIHIRFTQI